MRVRIVVHVQMVLLHRLRPGRCLVDHAFAIPLAAAAGAGIPLCVAAVITGGTFGDVTSPVAGMTNVAANAARADHANYMRYATPYDFLAAGIGAVLFLGVGLLG